MSDESAAERYFAKRMEDPAYAAAYKAARDRIDRFDAVVRARDAETGRDLALAANVSLSAEVDRLTVELAEAKDACRFLTRARDHWLESFSEERRTRIDYGQQITRFLLSSSQGLETAGGLGVPQGEGPSASTGHTEGHDGRHVPDDEPSHDPRWA